jgi:sugar phosphate isomerase/epimerase
MRLGVSAVHVEHDSLAALFDKLARYGFKHVELWSKVLERIAPTDDDLGRVRALAAQREVTVGYHAPFRDEHDLSSRNLEAGLRSFDETMLVTRKLGASHIVLHLGSETEDREAGIERVVRILEAEGEEIAGEGIAVHVENVPSGALGSCPEDIEHVLDALDADWLGFALDVGHAALTGGAAAWIARLGPRVTYTHICDNDGIEDLHLSPLAGTSDWPAILEGLGRAGFDGIHVLEYSESHGFEPTIELVKRYSGDVTR